MTAMVTIPYNPYIALGFPLVLVDVSEADESMIGYVESISHSLTADGVAVTVVGLSHFRHYNAREPKFWPAVGGNEIIPPWYDEKYFGVDKITSMLYEPYLGSGVFSVWDLIDGGSSRKPEDWIPILQDEYSSILKAGDTGKFQYRPLMSFEDWKAWRGATGTFDEISGKFLHGPDNPIYAGDIKEVVDWVTPALEHETNLNKTGQKL